MSNVGRPRKVDRPYTLTVKIPTSLYRELSIVLMDPVTGSIKYGALGGLIESLLREWLEDKKRTYQETGVIDNE